ncbi:MAG: creatininase family protein [Micrococcaceae bacterium]
MLSTKMPDRTSIVEFGKLTSPEASICKDAMLILPIGALEQHGNGLPLFTDTVRADHVAMAVARRLTGRAFVMPTLPYGVSPHHASFDGTVSLPATLFIETVLTVVRSVADAGWRRLLVVSGHGGNGPSLGVVEQELLSTHPWLHFAWTQVTPLAKEALSNMTREEVSGHSGESETAQVLAIDADLVDRDALASGACRLEDMGPKASLSRTSMPSMSVRFEEYAENGVLGDPRTATIDQGQRALGEIVDRLVDYSHAMLDL